MEARKIVGRIIKVSKGGWGFISSRDIEFTRIFFHWTALKQDTLPFLELHTGMMVEFVPVQIPGKGWRAIHVTVLERNNDMSILQERGSLDDGKTEANSKTNHDKDSPL
jgi:cold shock CspA family protein